VPGKSEIERKTKGKIREKISPPWDPATVYAGGWGPPVVGMHQGAHPLSVYFRAAQAWVLGGSHKSSTSTYNHIAYLYN